MSRLTPFPHLITCVCVVHHACHPVLRALAESRIRWAFWPPGTPPETIAAHQQLQETGAGASTLGIWIPDPDDSTGGATIDSDAYAHSSDSDLDAASELGETAAESGDGVEVSDESEGGEEDDDDDGDEAGTEAGAAARKAAGYRSMGRYTGGRFGALTLDGSDDADDDSNGTDGE